MTAAPIAAQYHPFALQSLLVRDPQDLSYCRVVLCPFCARAAALYDHVIVSRPAFPDSHCEDCGRPNLTMGTSNNG